MHPTWSAALATLRVAAEATALSLFLGVWLGRLLQGRKAAGAAACGLLILPPTIICSYFLFRPFTAAVAIGAATFYGLPFLALAACLVFQSLDGATLNAARIAGASEWRVFWRIALPLALRPLLAAAAIIFARIGTEYAATLWIAQVQSIQP
jgi:molybdate transport system permease protein